MMIPPGGKRRVRSIAASLALALSFAAGCRQEEEARTSTPPSPLPTAGSSRPVPPTAPRTDQGGETREVGSVGRDMSKDLASPRIEPGGPTTKFPPAAKPTDVKPDDATKSGQP